MSGCTQDCKYCNCRILNEDLAKNGRFIIPNKVDDGYHRVVIEDLNTRLQYWMYNESTL